MSIELPVYSPPGRPWLLVDGLTLELWACGHWMPSNTPKYEGCRFCPAWSITEGLAEQHKRLLAALGLPPDSMQPTERLVMENERRTERWLRDRTV